MLSYKISIIQFSKIINKSIIDTITELKYFHTFFSLHFRFINKGITIQILKKVSDENELDKMCNELLDIMKYKLQV